MFNHMFNHMFNQIFTVFYTSVICWSFKTVQVWIIWAPQRREPFDTGSGYVWAPCPRCVLDEARLVETTWGAVYLEWDEVMRWNHGWNHELICWNILKFRNLRMVELNQVVCFRKSFHFGKVFLLFAPRMEDYFTSLKIHRYWGRWWAVNHYTMRYKRWVWHVTPLRRWMILWLGKILEQWSSSWVVGKLPRLFHVGFTQIFQDDGPVMTKKSG